MNRKIEDGYDEGFWNDSSRDGSIRNTVAVFMENNDTLTKIHGEDWFKIEDEIVGLIEGLKEKIFKEAIYEKIRSKIYEELTNSYFEVTTDPILNTIPIEVINKIADECYEIIMHGYLFEESQIVEDFIEIFNRNDVYKNTIHKYYGELYMYKQEAIDKYARYLKDWYGEPERIKLRPLPIESYLATKESK